MRPVTLAQGPVEMDKFKENVITQWDPLEFEISDWLVQVPTLNLSNLNSLNFTEKFEEQDKKVKDPMTVLQSPGPSHTCNVRINC